VRGVLAERGIVVSRWLRELIERRGYNRAAVAVANKNARVIQALLSSERTYQRPAAA
jgi:transposase